jgi:hypothetical protein
MDALKTVNGRVGDDVDDVSTQIGQDWPTPGT